MAAAVLGMSIGIQPDRTFGVAEAQAQGNAAYGGAAAMPGAMQDKSVPLRGGALGPAMPEVRHEKWMVRGGTKSPTAGQLKHEVGGAGGAAQYKARAPSQANPGAAQLKWMPGAGQIKMRTPEAQ